MLVEFLNNGNKPYVSEAVSGTSLLNSGWVHKVECSEAKQVPIKTTKAKKKSSVVSIQLEAFETIAAKYQYKLKDEIYADLKNAMAKCGKISNLER